MRQELPASPYFIFLSRYSRHPIMEVWPVALAQSLPVIPLPLLYGDADVTLDLQAAFTAIYDAVGFDLLLNYRQEPDVLLEEAEAQWARDILKKAAQ